MPVALMAPYVSEKKWQAEVGSEPEPISFYRHTSVKSPADFLLSAAAAAAQDEARNRVMFTSKTHHAWLTLTFSNARLSRSGLDAQTL